MKLYGTAKDIFKVEGKKALVTGGTSGLGKGMATCLIENGCDVAVVGRDTSKCADLVELAGKLGCKLVTVSCDVTDEQSVMSMVSKVYSELGTIDILIHSAGGGFFEFLTEMSEEVWDKTVNGTLKSKFLVIREVAKIMKQKRYGRIISISSMSSIFGSSGIGNAAYCAAMGGVNAFTRQVACELAQYNVTVNAIAPTFMKTPYVIKLLEENQKFADSLKSKFPVGRTGEVADIIGLMMLLASDASSFITGQTILLDGGISARGSNNEEFVEKN
jgi:NAD(P)-dependent dehydrogenase (short-subunit alcohol dehydrogenase family)